MGFVHYNNTLEDQVQHVFRAKRHVPGYITSPLVLGPEEPIFKIDQLKVSARLPELPASRFSRTWLVGGPARTSLPHSTQPRTSTS